MEAAVRLNYWDDLIASMTLAILLYVSYFLLIKVNKDRSTLYYEVACLKDLEIKIRGLVEFLDQNFLQLKTIQNFKQFSTRGINLVLTVKIT